MEVRTQGLGSGGKFTGLVAGKSHFLRACPCQGLVQQHASFSKWLQWLPVARPRERKGRTKSREEPRDSGKDPLRITTPRPLLTLPLLQRAVHVVERLVILLGLGLVLRLVQGLEVGVGERLCGCHPLLRV